MNAYNYSFSIVGAFLSFAAFQRATGNAQVIEIYKSCIERRNSGIVKSTTAEWIGRLLAYLISVLSAVLAGGYSTGTLEAGIRGGVFMAKTHGGVIGRSGSSSMSLVIGLLLILVFVVVVFKKAGERQPMWLIRACIRLVDRLIG